MKKKLIILGIIIFVSGLALVGVAKTDKLSVSGFSNPFQNIQAQPLTDDGTTTYFTDQTSDFAVGGTGSGAALWFDESAGDLTIDGKGGIGTSTPGYQLVISSGTDNNVAHFESTDADASISLRDQWTGWPGTAINRTGNDLDFRTNETARLWIKNSTGNVGINTSTPQTNLGIKGIMSLYPDGTGTTTCSSLIEGALMYATGTQGFYFCNGSAWTAF